ncbi:MAG: M20/M25/M40 family metallo-hydrolase [Candidatus Thorarchaeota archaeon]
MRNIHTIGKYLDDKGVPYEIFETAPERGNLLAEIKGTGGKPSLMFGPSHVDVVPVLDERKWSVPPFEGIVKDGCVWGRGSLDMLYFVATQTVVFAKLYGEGFKPKGNLKLLIVADEESAGTYGAKWMIQNHPEKVRVDYLITEQGGEPIGLNRIAYWYGEKGMAWTRVTFKGEEQHGSAPYKSNNAVVKAANAVQRLSEYQPPRSTQFIKPLLEKLDLSPIVKKLASNTRTLPQVLGSLSKENMGMARFLHALTQMTISPNIFKGGSKVNVVAGEAYIDVDIRLLPGQSEEDAYGQIREALGDLAAEAEIKRIPKDDGGDMFPGTSSDVDSPLVSLMAEVAREIKGQDVILVPLLSTGGTDARLFRDAFSTQSYGFAISDDLLNLQIVQSLFHGDDERVSIGQIDLTMKAYYEIATRFVG